MRPNFVVMTRFRSRKFGTRLVLLALVAGLSLVACGSGDSVGEGFEMEPPLASDSTMADSIREEGSIQEQVITTANVFVEVKSLDAAVDEVVERTQAADGTIDAQSIYRQNGSASAMMTVRVPSDGLTSFLADIEELGTVRSTDINSQDVTLEVIDIEARITTLEDSISRLRELQQQSTSVSDLVAVEAELANRQSELESLTARRDYLANQVELSTVYLTLSEEETGPATSPDFLGGLQRGWDALLTLGAGLITGIGFLAPTAAVVGIVIVVVLGIVRVRRSRRNQGS